MKKDRKYYQKLGEAVSIHFPNVEKVLNLEILTDDLNLVSRIISRLEEYYEIDNWNSINESDLYKYRVLFPLIIVRIYCPNVLLIDVPITKGLTAEIQKYMGASVSKSSISRHVKLWRDQKAIYFQLKNEVEKMTFNLCIEMGLDLTIANIDLREYSQSKL